MIALVVLVASMLLIGNTIQVAADQRRNETSIMRLVGASRWMTELPFMLETMIAAAIGGLIAVGFIGVGKYYVLDDILAGSDRERHDPEPRTPTTSCWPAASALIVGIVLSALTAFATLRLYVRL